MRIGIKVLGGEGQREDVPPVVEEETGADLIFAVYVFLLRLVNRVILVL